MQNTPGHFMISVTDMDKSISFYRDKLGLKILDQTADWTEMEFDNGLILALKKSAAKDHENYAGFGYAVDDCEAATKRYESLGVEISLRCHKTAHNVLTQFLDPDGNVIWLSQHV